MRFGLSGRIVKARARHSAYSHRLLSAGDAGAAAGAGELGSEEADGGAEAADGSALLHIP